MQNILKKTFEIDLRGLALFRIGFGIILIFDLAIRSLDIENHYTDFGVLPRIEAIKTLVDYAISIHLAGGSLFFQTVLFILSFIFTIGYVTGFKTRFCTIAIWFLLMSLQNRNVMLLNGVDGLKIILLFWSAFLPLGARYSLDSLDVKNSSKSNNAHLSFAGAALLILSVIIYFYSFFYKTGTEWYPDGTALYYALHIGSNVTHLGVWFRQFESILYLGTFATLLFEFFVPILIFITCWNYAIRLTMVGVLIAFNFGIALFFAIGEFPFVNMLTPILFIPKIFWDILEKNLFFIKISNWLRGIFSNLNLQSDTPTKQYNSRFRKLAESFSFVIFISLMIWNISALPQIDYKVPNLMDATLRFLGLRQNWNMYGPKPHDHSGWYLISGKLMDESAVDVTRKKKGKTDFSRPKYLVDTYKTERWRKYLDETRFRFDSKRQLLNYGRFICRSWNRGKPEKEQLATFQIHFMWEKTLLNYEKAEIIDEILWYHDCFAP